MQQLPTSQCRTAAQKNAGDHGAQQAVAHHAVQIVILACTHVLAGKGHGGLRKGVHGRVDEAFQIGRCRASSHDRGAEGIDGGLDHHIGQAEHGALQARRQADEQDLLQGTGVKAQLVQVQMQRALFPHQHGGDQAGRHCLTDDGGQRNARHAHGKADDEHKVQHHIDDTGRRQTVQRTLGVAHGPQQSAAEVVQHVHGHADEVDLEVQRRKVDDILRAAHELQQAAGGKKAHHGQQYAAGKAQRHGGVHGVLYAVLVLCAKAAGSYDVRAQREPNEQVHQQIDQGTVGADCGQRGAAGKAAHHHNVCRVEQQLQNAGCSQRNGKQNDLLQHRAAGQVSGTVCPGLRHGVTRLLEMFLISESVDFRSYPESRAQVPIIRQTSAKCKSPGTANVPGLL